MSTVAMVGVRVSQFGKHPIPEGMVRGYWCSRCHADMILSPEAAAFLSTQRIPLICTRCETPTERSKVAIFVGPGNPIEAAMAIGMCRMMDDAAKRARNS